MTQRPTLSLAMIVRDEERRLARALASVRGLVGEVVVVDTGSRDATAALAAECGARVIERPWTEDFAEARNASLEACRGEWILQLDADEALDAEARKAIAEAVHREDVEGWFLRQRNYVPGGCQSIRAMRLWRNEPEARFVYPIHEQILPGVLRAAARTGRRIETLEAGVEHYGYLQEPEVVAAKLTRNARLMERWLAEHPEDLYLRYVLAGTLAQLGRPEDALGAYARAFRLLRTLSEDEARRRECGPNLCALYGQALLRDRADRDGARQIVSFGRRLFPEAPELLFLDGVLAREEGDLGRAIRCFSACAERGPRAEALHADEGVTGVKALLALGECWEAVGNAPRARETYGRAREAGPEDFAPVHRLARLAAEGGAASEALGLYEDFLARHPKEALARLHGAMILLDFGRLAEAGAWLEEAGALAPGDGRAPVQRARLALALGEPERALALAAETGLADPDAAATALVAAEALDRPLPAVASGAAETAEALLARVRDLAAAGRTELLEKWLGGRARLAASHPAVLDAFARLLDEGRRALTDEDLAA